jgi:biotin transport system substrate-specific component
MAVGAALTAVCSWISIPSTVPFTLQTFAVFCVLSLLGGKRGTVSIIIYILLGAVGMPVFAGFTGGIGILLGTTGGYIIGFILMGLLFWLAEHFFGDALPVRIVSMLAGLLVCYAFGTGWFLWVYARQSGAIGIGTALSWCVLPFILPDLAKMALAVGIAGRVKKFIH